VRRRAILAGLGAACVAAGASHAQAPARIGYLAVRDGPHLEGFRRELAALGLVEGRDVAIELRSAEGVAERLAPLAAELLALDPAALVVTGSTAAIAARRATRTVPIVFAMLGDPVALGVVDGLARPGGNATGIAGMSEEMGSKRLQLLRSLLPGAERVAILVSPVIAVAEPEIVATEVAARRLGIRMLVLRAGGVEEIDPMLAALAASDAQAVTVSPNALLATQPQMGRVVRAIAAARLPAIYVEPDWIAAGGLMTYAPSLTEFGRHSARTVVRILRGARPADLPVEQATRYELVLNLPAAREIGLAIPPSVLALADEVIE
jgi:putative ABC transport system substrate-binding protein